MNSLEYDWVITFIVQMFTSVAEFHVIQMTAIDSGEANKAKWILE